MTGWPLRYRIAYRIHSRVNKVHYTTGEHAFTGWLNHRVAALWTTWWIQTMRERERERKRKCQ